MSSKISFNKLKLTVNTDEIREIDFKGETITVKQYLPAKEKIDLVTRVLQESMDENSFPNPMKIKILTSLELVFSYSNINFTEKQKEDACKLYDLLFSGGDGSLGDMILLAIPADEEGILKDWINETVKNFYNYKNSALGLMEQITQDYSNLKLDAEEIRDNLANADNLSLLKSIVTKMG